MCYKVDTRRDVIQRSSSPKFKMASSYNFQDLVTKGKNVVALAPVLGAISHLVMHNAVRIYFNSCILVIK